MTSLCLDFLIWTMEMVMASNWQELNDIMHIKVHNKVGSTRSTQQLKLLFCSCIWEALLIARSTFFPGERNPILFMHLTVIYPALGGE